MTIIVRCDCGRTLRAPDQMSGRTANCVCGHSVPLLKEAGPRQFDVLEPELGDAAADAEPAPQLLSRRKEKQAGTKKSLFRPSQGRNVERGEEENPPSEQPVAPQKRKKRRKDKVTSTERKRQRNEAFLAGLGRSLKFPLRPESLLTIGVMAVAYGVFTAVAGFLPYGVLGLRAMAIMLLGTLMILGYFGFFLLQIFRLASIDEDDLPLTLEFDADVIRQDLWIWIGTLWWCGMPYAAYWWITTRLDLWGLIDRQELSVWAALPILAISVSLFPMALMSTALHLAVLAANPWTVVRSILRVPLEYLATFSLFGTLCATAVAIGRVLPPYPSTIPVLSHIVTWVLLFYALTASAYGFGNFYYRNRLKIGWFAELPRQI